MLSNQISLWDERACEKPDLCCDEKKKKKAKQVAGQTGEETSFKSAIMASFLSFKGQLVPEGYKSGGR